MTDKRKTLNDCTMDEWSKASRAAGWGTPLTKEEKKDVKLRTSSRKKTGNGTGRGGAR